MVGREALREGGRQVVSLGHQHARWEVRRASSPPFRINSPFSSVVTLDT
jgi:hypothetical protein